MQQQSSGAENYKYRMIMIKRLTKTEDDPLFLYVYLSWERTMLISVRLLRVQSISRAVRLPDRTRSRWSNAVVCEDNIVYEAIIIMFMPLSSREARLMVKKGVPTQLRMQLCIMSARYFRWIKTSVGCPTTTSTTTPSTTTTPNRCVIAGEDLT